MLAGYNDPRRTHHSGGELDIRFTNMLKTYKDSDPVPRPQVALPVAAIECAAAAHQRDDASPIARATAQLIIIAFFFLLRVGEYTKAPESTVKRTVPFRLCDVKFWNNQQLLQQTIGLEQLQQATSVTLHIENQKNGQKGDTIHHEACAGSFCPVKALAARVSEIHAHNMPMSTPLSYVKPGTHVQSRHILHAVRHGARVAKLEQCGYDLSRIGSHSLRASGAMALWLSGHSAEAIMKMGRWRTNTFLTYIHSQIASLTRNISSLMSRRIAFHNVGG